MWGFLGFVGIVAILGIFGTVSGNVSQCYHCNNEYCGDPFDGGLGGRASCLDVFKNARMKSGRMIASASASSSAALENNFQIGTNNSEDIETLGSQEDTNEVNGRRTHADFFDIQRKIWEFFNKGEINENTEFVCVKASYYSENGERRIYRGCVPKYTRTIPTACEFVNQKVAGVSTNHVNSCYTCESNLCNNAINLKNSMFASLILGIILIVVVC